MELWIAGKWLGEVRDKDNKISTMWELQGAFDSEDKAVDICKGHDDYFIGPAILNKSLPDETAEWEGCYYPFANTENVDKEQPECHDQGESGDGDSGE